MSTAAARPHFYPTRFKDAARYYTDGRPFYPHLLSRRIAELIGLDRRHSVLDIGTGPGFLAIDFAAHAGRITGLDPSAEMLDIARSNAARVNAAVTFVQGTSYDLGPGFDKVRLTTFGRSFHWTDRVATLKALDTLTEPGGAVALIGDSFPRVSENAWHAPFEALLDQYGKHDEATAKLAGEHHHEDVLLASAFSHLERISVIERRRTPVEHFINRALSFGKVWHGNPDFNPQELADAFSKTLAPFIGGDGRISEVIEGTALVARRPGDLPELAAT